jgi:exodeoxyribonuclease VII small subunit
MNKTESSEEPSFEEALATLEAIVRRLEDNSGSLDEAMQKYEEGIALIRRCQEKLRLAEQRILLLTGIDEDNNPVVRPFEHQATADKKRQ